MSSGKKSMQRLEKKAALSSSTMPVWKRNIFLFGELELQKKEGGIWKGARERKGS